MLSNYSSFLELLAGVYFSMCLDNVLTQKIWTVDYFAAFRRSLEGMTFGGNTSIATEVVDNNRDLISMMQAKLTKKSVYMLAFISLMLLSCGFEADKGNCTTVSNVYLFVLVETIAVSIVLLFSNYIFGTWKRTWVATIIPLTVCAILSIIPTVVNIFNSTLCIPTRSIVYFVLFVVIYPILWQIFKVWVYKSLFFDYVNCEMIKVRNEYETVLSIIENGGDTTKLPKEYGEILQHNTIKLKKEKAQKAIDSSISAYSELLQSKLRKIGYETSLFTVFLSSFKRKPKVEDAASIEKRNISNSIAGKLDSYKNK